MIMRKTPLDEFRSDLTDTGSEAARLFGEAFRLNAALAGVTEDMAREAGLTGARWMVLSALAERPATVADTARAIRLTRQSVQRTMDNLADSDFVEYHDNPGHKRARLARLTDKGKAGLESLRHKQAKWLDRISEDLPPANIRISTGIIRGLLRRIDGLG